MERKAMPGQKGPIMTPTTPDVEKPDAGPSAGGTAVGKGFFGSIARKKFSKAVSLVKFALKFDNNLVDDNKSMFSQKSAVQVQMENTYRMEPNDATKFSVKRSENVIRETFEEHLSRYRYSLTTAPLIIKTLCTVIKDKVKKLGFQRYKIVVNVFLSSLDSQGMEATSRCLWDDKKDTFACASYQGPSFMALGIVHGVYME